MFLQLTYSLLLAGLCKLLKEWLLCRHWAGCHICSLCWHSTLAVYSWITEYSCFDV